MSWLGFVIGLVLGIVIGVAGLIAYTLLWSVFHEGDDDDRRREQAYNEQNERRRERWLHGIAICIICFGILSGCTTSTMQRDEHTTTDTTLTVTSRTINYDPPAGVYDVPLAPPKRLDNFIGENPILFAGTVRTNDGTVVGVKVRAVGQPLPALDTSYVAEVTVDQAPVSAQQRDTTLTTRNAIDATTHTEEETFSPVKFLTQNVFWVVAGLSCIVVVIGFLILVKKVR